MALKEELRILNDFVSEEISVLSVYLNTNPADPEQRNDAWKIHLKNQMRDIELDVESRNDTSEMKLFKESKKKVIKEIESKQTDLNKGVIIFASADPELWTVYYVQVPVKTSFHWGVRPEIEQLLYISTAYPKAGIILPALDEVRILDTSMGVLTDELTYVFDPGNKQWKQKKGVAYGSVRASSAKHVDAYDDRIRENLLRFYKQMGTTVERLKKERKWEEIHVSGEAELANSFSGSLQKKPESCLYKNLNNSEPNKVLYEIFEI